MIQQVKTVINAVLEQKKPLTARDINVLGKKLIENYKKMFQALLVFSKLVTYYANKYRDNSIFVYLNEMQTKLVSFILSSKSRVLNLVHNVDILFPFVTFLKYSLLYDLSFVAKSKKLTIQRNKLVVLLKNIMNDLRLTGFYSNILLKSMIFFIII